MSRLRLNKLAYGLMERERDRLVPEGFTPSAENVDLNPDGSITIPRGGAVRFTNGPLAHGKPVRGLWRLQRNDGTKAILAACDNALWRIKPFGEAERIGDLYGSAATRYTAAVAGGSLYICSGAGSPQVYDTELIDLADLDGADLPAVWGAGNWPSACVLLNAGTNECMAYYGAPKYPSTAWGSALFQPTKFNETDSWNLSPGDGDGQRLVGLASFHSLILFVKERRTLALNAEAAVNPSAPPMTIIPFGGDSQAGIISTDNDAFWSSPEGFVRIRAAIEPGAAALGTFSAQRIPDSLSRISRTRREQICAVWDHSMQRIRFSCPSLKDVTNDLIFDYYPYLGDGAWMVSTGLNCECFCTIDGPDGPTVLAGDADGWINRVGFTRQDFGENIPAHHTFPVLELGYRGPIPIVDWYVREGGENLQQEMSIDGGEDVINKRSLASTFAGEVDPHRARLVNHGVGHEFKFTLRHKGGASAATITGLSGDPKPLGGR